MPSPRFSSKSEKKREAAARLQQRRDPYEVLGVSRNSTDQEIKSAYRRMALKFHPDKNRNDPVSSDMFKEVTFSYNILSDPDKRRQYDTSGFEFINTESHELELDLSSLGTVNTMFAALFSKLGVPIKTTVSATVLEEALNGSVTVNALQLGKSLCKKVEKQCAHFYSVEISESEVQTGVVCRVHSINRSKFKLLYFEQEENGGLSLVLQEDGVKTGKVTCAGMFFLGFPVYRFDQTSSMFVAKDPDVAFFKKLDGFQPCELNELKAGRHIFAVYGDNFFKCASYTIEIMCGDAFSAEKEKLRDVEAKLLAKRAELSKFEMEYREVLAQFTEMTNRYALEMQTIDELLNQRNMIHASYTTIPSLKRTSSSIGQRSSSMSSTEEDELPAREKSREWTKKKKWFNLHSKVEKRRPC
ncbi:Chaperone protein dnaJ 16 [Apostasia shenzhenica]|uniref:Chaperone protein dnaJ 16 n=1 Tax=Apostasia shenzhenica TaxID=1088818 RepID=A0A2I0A7I4_9ASPA|nr:Chaperone protein dnaJ 16 [Apostasia shenzhenica]